MKDSLEAVLSALKEIGMTVVMMTGDELVTDEEDKKQLKGMPKQKAQNMLENNTNSDDLTNKEKAMAVLAKLRSISAKNVLALSGMLDSANRMLARDSATSCLTPDMYKTLSSIAEATSHIRAVANTLDLQLQSIKPNIEKLDEKECGVVLAEFNKNTELSKFNNSNEDKVDLTGVTNLGLSKEEEELHDDGIPLPPLANKGKTSSDIIKAAADPNVGYSTLVEADGTISGVAVVHWLSPTRITIEVVKRKI